MHLVTQYIRDAGKGVCYVCHAHKRSKDELILDTGRHIDFEGDLLVCGPCIAEAAKLTGVVEAATEALTAERDAALARAELAEDELDRALTALDALRKAPVRRKPAVKDDSGD